MRGGLSMVKPKIGLSMLYIAGETLENSVKSVIEHCVKFIKVVTTDSTPWISVEFLS